MNLPHYGNLDINSFERMLDDTTTSYKLYWFSGIFKEVINGHQVIPFRRIVCRMICEAWYSLIEFRLNFGVLDQLSDTVMFIHKKYGIQKDVQELEFLQFLEKVRDNELERRIENFYKYVPYRLLHPFFSLQLRGNKDAQKNKIIVNSALNDKNCFYKILLEEKCVIINEQWCDYITNNQGIISGWLNYKLIDFLQRKNPNVPAIPFKLRAPQKRDLTRAKRYWKKVLEINQMNDIYSGNPLLKGTCTSLGSFSIDHFIPWSFVLHDEMWNLLPTFKNINSSKSDCLPSYNRYFERFAEFQYKGYLTATNYYTYFKKDIEDYLTIIKGVSLNSQNFLSKDEFTNSLAKTINPLYELAYNQGFGIWEYKSS